MPTPDPERMRLRELCEKCKRNGWKVSVDPDMILAFLGATEPTQDTEVARVLADLRLRSDAGARTGRIQTARAMDDATAELIERLARERDEAQKQRVRVDRVARIPFGPPEDEDE
jgi:hypothetical protein